MRLRTLSNVVLCASVLLSVCLQFLLLRVAPFHDTYYRSFQFLHPDKIQFNPAGGFASSLATITWHSDWTKQLLIHPPGNYLMYWIWTGLFGDSQLSLAIPSFLAGMFSLFLYHRIFHKISGEVQANITISVLAVSAPFCWYSIMPVDAIFDLMGFAIGIYGILKLIDIREGSISLFLFSQFIAVLFAYYYLFVLCLLFLYFLYQGRYALSAIILIFVLPPAAYLGTKLMSGIYSQYFPFWQKLGGVQDIFLWYLQLPFRVHHWSNTGVWSTSLLGWLAVLGLILTLASRPHQKKIWIAIIFIGPALLLLIFSKFIGALGHQRNIFFLLPLYLYFISIPAWNNKLSNVLRLILIPFLIYGGIDSIKRSILYVSSEFASTEIASHYSGACIGIEADQMTYIIRSYKQTTALAHNNIRWLASENLQELCTHVTPECHQTLIITKRPLAQLCSAQPTLLDTISVNDVSPVIATMLSNSDEVRYIYRL